jgi:hypothetical protein
MSKNKLHFNDQGFVYGFGNIEASTNFIEIEDYESALAAFSEGKCLKVVAGELVISDSREERLRSIREVRDILLLESDKLRLKLADFELISGTQYAQDRLRLALYRQGLRDITLQDPFTAEWPVLEPGPAW